MTIQRCLLLAFFLALQTMGLFSQETKARVNEEEAKIVFVSYRTGNANLFLMDRNGKNLKQLTRSTARNSFPFQIDRRTVGFTRTDSLNKSELYQIDIFTLEEKPFEENKIRPCSKWQEYNPRFNKWVFVRSNDYQDRELYLFDPESGEEKQLTTIQDERYKAYSVNHSWSPDGNSLVFLSGPDWYNQFVRLYDVNLDSIRTLSSRGYMNSGIKWLKDNQTLIANLKIKGVNSYELYSLDSKSGDLKQLTTGINLHPDVSPDGEWIVFESQRHQNDGEVYIMKKDGSEQTRLTFADSYDGRCIWFDPKMVTENE